MDELREYHSLRHKIFTSEDGLGRTDLYTAAGFETDIWDLPIFEPVHFLVRHADKAIACARMAPSHHPTMMVTLFSHFVDGPCPCTPDVWEIQRLGVDLTLPSELKTRALLRLMIGMQRYAQSVSAKAVMLLTLEKIYQKRLQMMRPMGKVHMHLNMPHIALMNELSEAEIALMESLLTALEKDL